MTAYIPGHMLIQWHITERCNLQCTHCYQETLPPPDPTWDQLMAAREQLTSFVSRCRAANPAGSFRADLTITGGEPFIRGDFMDLMAILSAEPCFSSLAVLTNGTMLTPAFVHRLKALKPGFVQVSLDGSRETHDRIRGAGSYDQAVSGLRLLLQNHIPAHIAFTAHQDNFRDFPSVADLGQRLGVTKVWSDRMVPCGRAGSSSNRLLTPAETREFFGIMQQESRRGWLRKSRVKLQRSLQFMASGRRPYQCSAGDTLVTVLPNGDVCPCRRMPLVTGNIFSEDLMHIYTTSRLFQELRDRDRISPGCESCFYSRTCGGGARCLSSAMYGDPFRADPGCWLAAEFQTDC
ncbi:MAG: hypothetical protein C0402_01865 [Thermodesulfovibrio sp.]|nr:hypothetical protein [Thermodesulfovibrio sp.]